MVFSFDAVDSHLPLRGSRSMSVSSQDDCWPPIGFDAESPTVESKPFAFPEAKSLFDPAAGGSVKPGRMSRPGNPGLTMKTNDLGSDSHEHSKSPFSPTFHGKPLYGGGRRRASIVAAANSEAIGADVAAIAASLEKPAVQVQPAKGGLSALFSCIELDSRAGSENESGKATPKGHAEAGGKKKRKSKKKASQVSGGQRTVKRVVSGLALQNAQTNANPVGRHAAPLASRPTTQLDKTPALTFDKFPASTYSTPPTSNVSSDLDEPLTSASSASPSPGSSPPQKGMLKQLLEEQRAETGDVVIVSSESGEPIESYEVALEHDFISPDLVSRPVTRSGSPDRNGVAELSTKDNLGVPGAAKRKVCAEDFEVLRCLGKGAYGTVLLVRHMKTGKLYAQKQLKKASIVVTKQLVDQTKAERTILESVRHPFVVKLYYAFQDHEKLYLILEYAQGGELFLHLATEKMFSEDVAAFYLASLVLALSHLHLNAGVVYRDLKPENCLLDAEGHLLLTDFGLSKVKTDDSACRSFLGTPEYMAPEILQGKEYDAAVDWWSLGALGVDLLTGSPPFTGNNNKKITEKILKQKLTLPYYLSSDAKDLLMKLLRKEPSKRLGTNLVKDLPIIKKHRFFRKINWDLLEKRQLPPPIVPMITDPVLAENFSLEFTSLACSPPVGSRAVGNGGGGGGHNGRSSGEMTAYGDEELFGGFSFVGSFGQVGY